MRMICQTCKYYKKPKCTKKNEYTARKNTCLEWRAKKA